MLSFFSQIYECIVQFLSSIWDFILHIGKDIVYLINLLNVAVSGLPSFLSWLPASALTLFVALFSICILYKVLGRD